MERKEIYLLSTVLVISCMSLPVIAGAISPHYANVITAYHNTHLENQGVMYLYSTGYCRFKIGISKGSGTVRGEVTRTVDSNEWIYSAQYSGWVDRSYNCDTVVLTPY